MDAIAAVDLCLALLLVPRTTRPLSAFLITAAMSVGVYMRVYEQRKDATYDLGLTAVAACALATSLLQGHSKQSTAHSKGS